MPGRAEPAPPPRDAAVTLTTGGEWEVELFELTKMPNGEMRMAHQFREYTDRIEEAAEWVRDWLPPGQENTR